MHGAPRDTQEVGRRPVVLPEPDLSPGLSGFEQVNRSAPCRPRAKVFDVRLVPPPSTREGGGGSGDAGKG